MESDDKAVAQGNFRDMDEDEYQAELDRVAATVTANFAADGEAMKHEVWACKIGDLLEITVPFEVEDWDDEKDRPTPPMPVFVGQTYRAAGLKGRGWDLELVPGEGARGAQYVRLMNWELLDHCKLLPPTA